MSLVLVTGTHCIQLEAKLKPEVRLKLKLLECQGNYLKYPLAVEDAPSVSHCFFEVAIYLLSHGLLQPPNCEPANKTTRDQSQITAAIAALQ